MKMSRRIVGGLTLASVAVTLGACAAAPTARVGPAPAYGAPVSETSVEARMRSIPTARVATRVRSESPGLEATESMLRDTLAGYGYSISLEPIPWPSAGDSAGWNNIVAEVRGNAKPEEVILVTAHFDAVPDSPGADDNASGVTGVMEVARRLSSPAFAEQTERTVRFVLFNIEEWGLHGAREHARLASLREGERIVGVINLEMIGYFTDEPGSQRSPIPRIPGVFDPPTVGDFISIVANQSSSPLARQLDTLMRSASPDLKTLVVDFIPGDGRAVPDTRRSDHAPFWDMGVPAVMVTDTSEFRNRNYHEPSDTVESLDLERMTLVIRGVEHAVRVMSGAMAPRTTEAAR